MDSQEIIAAYESILAIACQMRDVARQDEWDGLAALEQMRFTQIERLMATDVDDLADDRLNRRKAELIESILAADAETKMLAKAWMGELRGILDSLGAEKRLKAAYTGTNEWR